VTRLVSATRYKKKTLRRPSWRFFDFSTAGSGITVANPNLTPATGQVITQSIDGVRMQWTAANTSQQVGVRGTPSTAWDFSQTDAWGFEFDFSADPTCAALGGLRVIMASTTGGTYTNYWAKLVNTGVSKFGRRVLWINKADFGSPAAGSPTWDNIQRIEVLWQKSTRNTTVVPLDITFKGFYAGQRHQKAICIWTFDDGDVSQFSEAWSATTNPGHGLSAYGWPASFFVNSSTIGTGGKMTLANLQTLRDAGCGIYSHTHSHIANAWQYTPSISVTTLTMSNTGVGHGLSNGASVTVQKLDPIECNGTFTGTMADNFTVAVTIPTPEATSSILGYNSLDHITSAALRAEIQQCIDYLYANGFKNCGKHYAYPYGYHSANVVSLLQSMGIKTSRTLGTMTGSTQTFGWTGITNQPAGLDWYRMPARSIGSTGTGPFTTETAASVLADVDAAIKYGGMIPLLIHNLTGSPGATRDFALSEFVTLVDGLKHRERMGLIQFMEWDAYYEACLADAL